MRSSSKGRTWLIAAAVVLGLFVVVLSALALPLAPFRAVGVLAAELLHLTAAVVGGSLLMRLARCETPGLLGRLVFGGALGLGLLSLVSLALAGLGLCNAATPWVADALVLTAGLGRLRALAAELGDAWIRLDLSFVMASRIPLLAALAVVSLLHLAPPFLPSGPETGGKAHALTAQAEVRSDLRAALAARPDPAVTPVDGLLLHGRLSSGEAGARLHVALLAALLTAGGFLHARRRLGGRAAAWVGVCLASSPALLLLDVADPAACWIALHGFLFFAELSDWSSRPVPGKVTLACLHGGLCLSQSAAGLAVFGSVLLFTLLVESLVERQSPLRLLPGLAGILLIASATALPFALADAWLLRDSPISRAEARWVQGEEQALASGEAGLRWTSAGAGLRGPEASAEGPLRRLAPLGPLVLGLLLLLPFATETPEPLRHAVLMLLLAVLAWLLPPPWGTGALVLPVAALCAGAAARALLALGGAPAKLTALLVGLAAPVTLLAAFNAGPDLFTGAAVMTGGTSRSEALARFVPDHPLVAAVSLHARPRQDLVLLVGDLTDSQYEAPVLRWPAASRLREPEELASALRSAAVTLVALERSSERAPPPEALSSLESVGGLPEDGPWALYRVPRAGARAPGADEEPLDAEPPASVPAD